MLPDVYLLAFIFELCIYLVEACHLFPTHTLYKSRQSIPYVLSIYTKGRIFIVLLDMLTHLIQLSILDQTLEISRGKQTSFGSQLFKEFI